MDKPIEGSDSLALVMIHGRAGCGRGETPFGRGRNGATLFPQRIGRGENVNLAK